MAIAISTERKKELIQEFHQYFNITLKSANNFYNGFSHNIQYSYYQNTDIDDLLSPYHQTDLSNKTFKTVHCSKVIDGDTIVTNNGERIRLVGVNTPEKGLQGYDTSKKVMEKICLNQDIKVYVDSKKPKDNYGRTLAVITRDEANINKLLLVEGLAEIMYIPPSDFNPKTWAPNAPKHEDNETLLSTNLDEQFLNVTIPLVEICGDDYGIGDFLKYFNEDYNNIVITDSNNFNILYKCESYQKTLFIRIDPILVNSDKKITLTLHLLPKKYKGTDSILLFKDNYYYLNNKKLHLQELLTDRFYKKHRKYETDSKGNYILDNMQEKIPKNIINAYFQSGLNGTNRKDRFKINNQNYPEFDKFDTNKFFYQDYNANNQWKKETWTTPWDGDQEMYAEFNCDMTKYTGNMNNIQINACYSYNNSSPTNAVHYLGFKDITNNDIADRCALIDANLDSIINNKTTTNYISQLEYINEQVHFPISLNVVQQDNSYTHNHTTNIGRKHYKTIKYFNDRLYSEEKSIENNEIIQQGYTIGDWTDLSQ